MEAILIRPGHVERQLLMFIACCMSVYTLLDLDV